jgi:class 3 adenylate cyclase
VVITASAYPAVIITFIAIRPKNRRAFRPHRQDDRRRGAVGIPERRRRGPLRRRIAAGDDRSREDRRIRFGIGVNLGDIIVDGDDIFGDGVNVAARLEALSDPGGLCISRMVRDQIRDKLTYAFEDLGEQSVKKIARPVRVYALRPRRCQIAPPEPRRRRAT